jgi:hypothetical protein
MVHPEFVAEAVRDWIAVVGAKTAHIAPGSPWETTPLSIPGSNRSGSIDGRPASL